MQVSGLVVTPARGSRREEAQRPPPLHFPGGADWVLRRLRLLEELAVAPPPPALADFRVGAGGQSRAPQTSQFPPWGFSPFLRGGGATQKKGKYPSADPRLGLQQRSLCATAAGRFT